MPNILAWFGLIVVHIVDFSDLEVYAIVNFVNYNSKKESRLS